MPQPILSIREATIFQDEHTVLSNVNIEVKKGEFIYIIGKTGSGKSSFMKTIYADLKLKKGNASVVDYDLVNLKESEIPFLRRKIGIVFQDFNLLPDRNIYKNLLFVLKATGWKSKESIKQKIEEVLQQVGMLKHSKKMPHQISGGEQQRVAIARALLNNPDLILADEPTGNLDPRTSVEVMELLKSINKNGRTIIMVTHDYAMLLKFPAKTLKCEDGKIFEVIQKTL